MSALTPKADMCSALGDVCFVPIAVIETTPPESTPSSRAIRPLNADASRKLYEAYTGRQDGLIFATQHVPAGLEQQAWIYE